MTLHQSRAEADDSPPVAAPRSLLRPLRTRQQHGTVASRSNVAAIPPRLRFSPPAPPARPSGSTAPV